MSLPPFPFDDASVRASLLALLLVVTACAPRESPPPAWGANSQPPPPPAHDASLLEPTMNKAAFIDKAKAGLETRGFQCERRRDDQIRCKELQGFSYVITYLAGDQDRVTIEAYFAFKDGTSCEAALAKVNEFNAKLNTATGFCDDKGAGFGTYVLIPKRGIDADELGRFLTWFGRSISTGSTKVGLIDLLK